MLLFNQDRLKKYYLKKKSGEEEEIYAVAFELYLNLEEVLRKVVPKREAEPA